MSICIFLSMTGVKDHHANVVCLVLQEITYSGQNLRCMVPDEGLTSCLCFGVEFVLHAERRTGQKLDYISSVLFVVPEFNEVS